MASSASRATEEPPLPQHEEPGRGAAARPLELVLVGGGHAHVQVLARWPERALPGVRLTLLVDQPRALYSGMVPGFVAGQYRAEELGIDLAALARRAGARLVVASATRLDPRARRIESTGTAELGYDVASLDVGSSLLGLERPGVREHALPTRPLGAFLEGISRLRARQAARREGEPAQLVVVGAGAGGVELAFALRAAWPAAGPGAARVTLLEAGPRALPGLPDTLVRRALRQLRARGIALRLGARVEEVGAEALRLEGGARLPCDAAIWATGPAPPPLLAASPLPLDARGFLRVGDDLRVSGFGDLFAVGDVASLDAHPATPKAGVYAVRAGPPLLHNLRALACGAPTRRFRPQRDFLRLLNLGDGRALGVKWGVAFEGRWVWRWKDAIDRRFVERFRVSAPA